jgi:hypothetical protein
MGFLQKIVLHTVKQLLSMDLLCVSGCSYFFDFVNTYLFVETSFFDNVGNLILIWPLGISGVMPNMYRNTLIHLVVYVWIIRHIMIWLLGISWYVPGQNYISLYIYVTKSFDNLPLITPLVNTTFSGEKKTME